MKPSNFQQSTPPADFSWAEMETGIWEKVAQKKRKGRVFLLLLWFVCTAMISLLIWSFSKQEQIKSKVKPIAIYTAINMESCKDSTAEDCTNVSISTSASIKPQLVYTNLKTRKKLPAVSRLHNKPIDKLIAPPINLPTSGITTLSSLEIAVLSTPNKAVSAKKSSLKPIHKQQRLLASIGLNSFDARTQTVSTDTIERANFEQARIGFQLNACYEQDFSNPHFYWGMGLAYTQLQSRFQRYSERIITTAHDVYISPWGNLSSREQFPQDWQGQLEVYALEKRYIVHYNTHHLANIALYAGHQWKRANTAFYIQTGANFHFWQYAKGKTINTKGQIILLEDNYFKSNAGFSILLKSGLRYHISNDLSVFGQIGGAYHLNNWVNSHQLVEQRPHIYQFSLGVLRRF